VTKYSYPIATFTVLTWLAQGQVCGQGLGAVPVSTAKSGDEVAALVAAPLRWISWGSVQTGFGFRDNVLLSNAGEERSGFVRSGLDATVWRAPQGRADFFAALKAEGTRYFSARTVNEESAAILLTEWRYLIADVFKFSLDARGYSFDQIYDASDTDLQQVVTEVKTLGASIGPKARWTLRPTWWIEAQADAKRLTYPDGANNRSVREGTLRLGWQPGTRFEASVAGTEGRRNYDLREQNSVSGRLLAGTLLRIAEREGEFRIDATWDAAGRWKTSTRASVLRFLDNGVGYLNYRQRKITHEVELTTDDWLVALRGSARRVEFGLQTVGTGPSPTPQIRDDISAELHIERKLSARWTAYAEYKWERNRSNDVLASYYLNEGLLGIRWNWEK
jgi:hypothetical protein